ncbi:N-alpha-acetyltransferase 35, NatC auxiliary subunit-like isoform X2 [Antedon mediterranea]|uniref:N-alpha-acetyltransferase 35, NatC auxiliary subunit-like isoform X2 n=1 Tax=Antedon mediterranea TaxID=105859 RepID=UPI003AF715C4
MLVWFAIKNVKYQILNKVTWLEGHSLAQTVFTSLYTHNADIIEDRCIRAFTLAILKMVDIIKDKVIRAAVYEEEDFQPLLYGFQLASNVTEMRVCGMLKEVEEEYNKKIKMTRPRPNEKKDDLKELQHEQYTAVYTRIKATRMIYVTLLDLNKKEVKAGVEEAKKHLDQSSSLLSTVKQSINLGTNQMKESDTQQSNPDISTVMGFEPLVNQRLLPPTFPRYTKIVGRLEAIEYLIKLIERLKKVCQVTNQGNFQAIMDFFIDFSKECPCILSRSILQLIFLPFNNKRVFAVELIQDSIKDYLRTHMCFPIFLTRHPLFSNQQAKEHIDAFLNRAVRPICQLMQVHGHNRARQREKLAHALEELSTLQDEAEQLDQELKNIGRNDRQVSGFSNWALYYTLRTMIQYMQLGFELELYAVHEYHYIYWYLSEFLYKWLESTLRRLEVMLQEKESHTDQTQKSRINRKKAKRKKSRPIDREMTLVEAFQAMTCGYYKAMIGFKMSRKLIQPNCDFDQERIRYEHRLSAFTVIMTPPPVQYEHFLEMTNPSKYHHMPTSTNFFQMAQQEFQMAWKRFESVSSPTEEMIILGKIAKRNHVVVKLLASGKMSSNPPEFDFSSHSTYPIIKLK